MKNVKNYVFKDCLPLIEQYVKHLKSTGIDWGLIGPKEADVIWKRHIFNCATVSSLIDKNKSLIDVGTGAGLPGLVVSIMRPDIEVILIDSIQKKIRWLNMVIQELSLKNVSALRGRSENLDIKADYVTARAVRNLKYLLPITLPLLKKEGKLLAIKGKQVNQEIIEAKQELKDCNIKLISVNLDRETRIVQISHKK